MSTWNVYKVTYAQNSTHKLYNLFIATDSETDGTTMLVYGDLQSGMEIQVLGHDNPETIRGYISKEIVGTINNTMLQEVCGAVKNTPAPGPQMDKKGRKFRTDKPYYRSEDWVNDVVKKLQERGLLMM